MSLTGLNLPELSAFDPLVEGEGSIDPMGLASISDQLANILVPGLRARMRRVRFVTAMAVGAIACETLTDEIPADRISTPAVCFEWLVLEAFVRRLGGPDFPQAVPGSLKARTVVNRSQRLSAATYLKGPTVFGFNGVYKPFAIDSAIVASDLSPGARCTDLLRPWEQEQGFDGFTDAIPDSTGGQLRIQIRDEVRSALRAGHCATGPGSWLFGRLANALNPDTAGDRERRVLRALLTDNEHETRAELALHIAESDGALTEAQLLDAVRHLCSAALGGIVDAVVAYERLAALVDAVFRTLCFVSYALGTQPLTPAGVRDNEMISRCAAELPGRYEAAFERVSAVSADVALEGRLGEFAIPRSPVELVELVLAHHERVQSAKPPSGKRPWFEPLRDGWVVRGIYGEIEQPRLGDWFVHPVRVAPLRPFLEDSSSSARSAYSTNGRRRTEPARPSAAWPRPSPSTPTSSPRIVWLATSVSRPSPARATGSPRSPRSSRRRTVSAKRRSRCWSTGAAPPRSATFVGISCPSQPREVSCTRR